MLNHQTETFYSLPSLAFHTVGKEYIREDITGLIQWDTPNNKNTLLAGPSGMTRFNCAYTNLSHSKKCCASIQHSSSVAERCIVWVCEV